MAKIMCTPKTIIQFPVRIEQTLNDKFTEMSDLTHIAKSELVRIAVQKLIKEFQESESMKITFNQLNDSIRFD